MPIVVEGLEHVYMAGTPFATKVLHGVDLTVADGEFVGLIGPTRAGKSTLAQYLNGLYIPKQGRVVIDDLDTRTARDADLWALRRNVGLVFQYPEHQLFAETVGEDVAFGPANAGIKGSELKDRVEAALVQVGLDPATFYTRYIFALSGGQKRRAAIAGVLAMGPKVMVLDDPTAGLAPRGRLEIMGVIDGLVDAGMTVLLISSNLEEVAHLARRLVVIAGGRVVAGGTAAAVFSQVELLRRIGLGTLQTVELMEGLRQRGFEAPLDAVTVEAAAQAVARLGLRKGGEASGRSG